VLDLRHVHRGPMRSLAVFVAFAVTATLKERSSGGRSRRSCSRFPPT